ncbi:MAG: hypothetical protein IJM30_07430 [Thermoguttaceae bacterium]|nr:hypothetical protein [Thermoguttaceae bacterium]
MSEQFSYTDALRAVCRDVCAKIREFRRIDVDRVGFSFSVARNNGRYGGWASVTPLRFEGGALATSTVRAIRETNELGRLVVVRKRLYYKTCSVKDKDGREVLYIFNVMAPRFTNLTPIEKIDTIMHELYHINPEFNGDVRRFPGRNWQHGDKKAYDAKAASLSREWLATDPDPRLYEFLQYDAKGLTERYGRVVGTKFARPRTIPISEEEAFKLEPNLRTVSQRPIGR